MSHLSWFRAGLKAVVNSGKKPNITDYIETKNI